MRLQGDKCVSYFLFFFFEPPSAEVSSGCHATLLPLRDIEKNGGKGDYLFKVVKSSMWGFYFYFIFILLTSPNNKISDTTKKSVHIFTKVQAGTPQQRAPITADPSHRSLKKCKNYNTV